MKFRWRTRVYPERESLVVLPLQRLEFRRRAKHTGCEQVSRNICFGYVPFAVRQGQHRDAAATGEERHGRCSAGTSTYIRLYRPISKLALAMMHLRRARVAGRSFAAGAQLLTHVCTAGACVKTYSASASGGPAGGKRVATCLGRWRVLPQRAARREVQKPKPRGLQIVQKKIIFLWARLFQKGVARDQAVTEARTPQFYI
jgi:hypothetical protein